MKAARKPTIPTGYNTVMPYLRVKGCDKAIKFYVKAFAAREKYRLMMPGKKIGHAELRIGDSTVMLSEEFPEMGAVGPQTLKGTAVVLTLYVKDVDKTVALAKRAKAKVIQPPQDQFYGDRSARIEDPFGHIWSIQTRIENVSPTSMQKRLDAMTAPPPAPKPARKPATKKRK